MTEEIVEIHAIARGTIYGSVQGVGFRYKTQSLALQLNLLGSVRNLPDGTVEIFAQGPKQTISEFCEKLNRYWQGHMQPLTPTYLKDLHAYDAFVIKK